jgi:DNA-binding NtrC family response regulator
LALISRYFDDRIKKIFEAAVLFLSASKNGIAGRDRMFEQQGPREADRNGLDASAELSAKPRLLAIDDDNLHRMIICRVAARAGYAPAGAATYDEAAKLLNAGGFDCITLDLSLSAGSGIDMMRHLAASGCKTPIIVVSGCDEATLVESVKTAKSLRLNIYDSIRKPVDLVVLRYWLERLKSDRGASGAKAVAA